MHQFVTLSQFVATFSYFHSLMKQMIRNRTMDVGQNFERPNVERPMFRNLKIAREAQLSDFFIYEIFFCIFL